MKKVVYGMLLALLMISAIACSEDGGSSGKMKIAVAETTANDEIAARKRYLEEYIAPHYNVEFMFSESIEDSGELIDFIQNAADAGCVALIDISTQDYVGAARQCAKFDMYYAYNGEMQEEFVNGEYPNVVGAWGQSQEATAALFAEYLRQTASPTGEEGFCILSMNGKSRSLIISGPGLENASNMMASTSAAASTSAKYGCSLQLPLHPRLSSCIPVLRMNCIG